MVKHIVCFKLKGDADVRREVGINENSAEDWDVVLTAVVPEMEDVAVYANHPAHLAAAAIVGPHKEARACVDYYFA